LFTDFGAATSFLKFDRRTNTLTVDEFATTANDIGEYPMVIKLVDETDLKRSINNEVVYRFTLTIYKKVAYVGGVSTSSGVVILQKPSV
jgi:phage baseplate assembly protein gpV